VSQASRLLTRLGYRALRTGIRPPRSRLAERFAQQAFLRHILQQLRVNCVLDVGASDGRYARHLRMLGYVGQIVSFEPVPESYEKLTVAAAGDDLWSARRIALGAEKATRELKVLRAAGGEAVFSSLLEPRWPQQEPPETVGIEVERLDAAAANLLASVVNPRVFLKIDTQGYDVEVVRGAAGILDHVVALQCEVSVVPIYEEMPHYTEALAYYESLGFALVDLSVVNRTASGLVLEYDALMLRSEAEILEVNLRRP
jgi:FkbM family methyltransferase